MSRYYEMTMIINGFSKKKGEYIAKAIEAVWEIEDKHYCDDSEGEMWLTGRDFLSGGETEEEFAEKIANMIMKANGGPCDVDVRAVYLEELPFESYCFSEDDYNRWFNIMLPDWLFEKPVTYKGVK